MQDGDLRPKFRSPSFPEELDDKVRALENVAKKSIGKTENPPNKKKSSGQVKWKTETFGQKSFGAATHRCLEKVAVVVRPSTAPPCPFHR